ncbi:BZ3500_MvSof-1268-A1-R1_Chr3-1g05856 [Microbotryum saponariae]|uniref:BZ3500_MvSof-1268-A1-R1_Chr3-1g05856 protein n=1 Tax=Microbotryum saponariae TaxID=289078 RepID=A0A2X0NHG4_9BASI|nr:BZ3500_MvSof-1268-A1-R1_Chr3-1g05856 [Microbotryum saponariae]SDA05046.1 BZ3501_MvSof-1269-A2-R1_Chr3-1g05526 [Microbotryum saponariae]
MLSPSRVLEVKAKGDACNRCRLRRVRCTGVNGQPCAACTRTARFRNHDLDELYCGYHGTRPCSEESEDRVRPRKKRNRSGSELESSSLNKKSSSSPSSSSGKARSSTSKTVLRKRLPSSCQSPPKKSSEKAASVAEVVQSSNQIGGSMSIKRQPTEVHSKVKSLCTPPSAPEVFLSPTASTSHLPDLPELPDRESTSMHVDEAPSPVQTSASPSMNETGSIAEVFTVPYEYPALEDVFQDPGPAVPYSIDTLPDPSYFGPLSPTHSSPSSLSSMSASPLSSAYSSCASPCASLMLTPDAVPDAFYLGDSCIAPSLVGTMTSIATAAATTESTFSGLLAAVTTTPYWFSDPSDTVVTPCFEDAWLQWSPITDQKTFQAYPSPLS